MHWGYKQLGRLKMTEPQAGGSQTGRQWYSTRKQQSSLLPAHVNTPHHVPEVRGLCSAPSVSPKPYCWHFTTSLALPCPQTLQSREWEWRIGWTPLPQGPVQRFATWWGTDVYVYQGDCTSLSPLQKLFILTVSERWNMLVFFPSRHPSIKSQRPPTNTQWIIHRP